MDKMSKGFNQLRSKEIPMNIKHERYSILLIEIKLNLPEVTKIHLSQEQKAKKKKKIMRYSKSIKKQASIYIQGESINGSLL